MHKFLLVDISDNMYALVNNGKYGAINNVYSTTMRYYVVELLSQPYTLKDNKTFDKEFINVGGLIKKAE